MSEDKDPLAAYLSQMPDELLNKESMPNAAKLRQYLEAKERERRLLLEQEAALQQELPRRQLEKLRATNEELRKYIADLRSENERLQKAQLPTVVEGPSRLDRVFRLLRILRNGVLMFSGRVVAETPMSSTMTAVFELTGLDPRDPLLYIEFVPWPQKSPEAYKDRNAQRDEEPLPIPTRQIDLADTSGVYKANIAPGPGGVYGYATIQADTTEAAPLPDPGGS